LATSLLLLFGQRKIGCVTKVLKSRFLGLLLTTCVSVVADFKALTFQFITKLCTKILTLNLAQNPQLRLHFVCALNGKYIISSLNTIIILEKVQRVQVPYAQGSCLEAK